MITLHILGAGGATPTPTHGPAAYWLDVDGRGALLDPGPGALVRLVRQPGAPDRVDAVDTVLVSHLHLDHTADIAPLLFAAHSVLARNNRPLALAGPVGLGAYLARLREVYGSWLDPRGREVTVRELSPGDRVPLGDGEAVAFRAAHREDRFANLCLGYRFRDRDGHGLTYSGDTGPCPELVAATRGSSTLVVECSTPDDLAVDGHMSPGKIAELGREARPERIVLTHLYPTVAGRGAAKAVSLATGIPCEEARDGLVVRIP